MYTANLRILKSKYQTYVKKLIKMYEGPPKINTKTYDIFCSTKRDIVSKLSRHNLAKQTQTFKYTLYPCISNNLKFKTAKIRLRMSHLHGQFFYYVNNKPFNVDSNISVNMT